MNINVDKILEDPKASKQIKDQFKRLIPLKKQQENVVAHLSKELNNSTAEFVGIGEAIAVLDKCNNGETFTFHIGTSADINNISRDNLKKIYVDKRKMFEARVNTLKRDLQLEKKNLKETDNKLLSWYKKYDPKANIPDKLLVSQNDKRRDLYKEGNKEVEKMEKLFLEMNK